jgi:hypothetical protein
MELREIGYGDVNLIKQIQDKVMMVFCDENYLRMLRIY